MSDKAETMELKLHANRGEWVATVHTVRCTAPWLVKLGEKFYVRTSEPGESSFVYDHAERALSMTEVENAFDANLSVEVSRVEYAGTGVRTAGEVDKSEDNPSPETDVSTMNVPVAVDNIEDKLRLARAEVERLATVYADHSATIAEQSAEIERLKGELHEAVARTRAECDKGYAALFGAHQQMVADRDQLRLEVQKLKDLNFEAQDRYAALEAERDELRLEVARLRDRLLQSLAEGGADQAEAEKQVCTLADELDEANARAEKYLRVIEATNANAATMVNLLMAMADAGLRMPPYLPYPAKQGEADHG